MRSNAAGAPFVALALSFVFALSLLTAPAAAAIPSASTAQQLPAYLQGYRQGQLLCPGAALTGKVSVAIIDPMMATTDAPGDCTLSDMKAANPGTEFFAYLNIGAMRDAEPWNGVFQNSCADTAGDGGTRFAVTTSNPRVAKNPAGFVSYPGYPYLTVADLSPAYADACAAVARAILTTDAQRGTTSAPPARFDGIFLDDASMSPSHGQDMVDVGQWGPWANDDAYGRALIAAVKRFDATLTRTMGRDVPVAVNLGVYPAWSNQVNLAKQLASTRAVDFALREHVVSSGTGRPLTSTDMKQATAAYRGITAAGMPVVEHDYSVPLRELPSSAYRQGSDIGSSAPCLRDDYSLRTTIASVGKVRRTLDHRMTLGHLLQTRTATSRSMTATLSQAEPTCQDNAWDDDSAFEPVTAASVNTLDAQVVALTRAVTSGAYAIGDPLILNGVTVSRLSDGRVVAVNTTTATRSVTAHGLSISVPARSATIR
ncbi:hypothetical protein PTW37_01220 [Arthrobacter agilis]|uniref:hypothetical protein n=1 Tax=Arthrobacter agilis TaxID=37921 RepID=UPI0023658A98|nr:hypothetical protein [Arthrobacter agilis]WDF33586.1 hypothetical protein PTW37_01220 [Arthrobacter agilis]